MILNWKITKHETKAEASAANGFLKFRIVRMDGLARGFMIKINDRKLKCRPATIVVAMKNVDELMRGPVGNLMAILEPIDGQNRR